MIPMRARTAILHTIEEWEGGYVNHPKDPGGETKYGISKRSYPNVDIPNLTKELAINIYYSDFWTPLRCNDVLDDNIVTKLFDTAVNMGKRRAIRILQKALNDTPRIGEDFLVTDGIIGPKTLAAVNRLTGYQFDTCLAHMRKRQAQHYKRLAQRNEKLAVFLKGWLRRAAA